MESTIKKVKGALQNTSCLLSIITVKGAVAKSVLQQPFKLFDMKTPRGAKKVIK